MAVDILQDIIRKQKNPFVLELALPLSKLPDGFPEMVRAMAHFAWN